MKATVGIICAGVAAGLAIAAGIWHRVPGGDSQAPPDQAAAFDASLPVAERIAALEKAVGEERLARQLLQEEVFYLTGEVERLASPDEPGSRAAGAQPDGAETTEVRTARRGDSRRDSQEGRREALIAAGFQPAQADWIAQREQELVMESLRARFEAERSGEPVDWQANRTMVTDALRQELGDADYERYLEGSGRSTRVAISSVIESSPAQAAGLKPGDEIVRYDGERVFSMDDLTRRTMTGEPGQTVVVDVMREGNLMQVVLPRGPVGITGGRRPY